MTIRQRIVRVRRQYNQWVANQTLEDYALRFTATRARRWSIWEVCNTALGSSSFLALEAIGATITLSYGFENAFAAIVAVAAIIFVIGLPITYYAARTGVDIDLLTRGAGFGYIGSTITSLIYAAFTFIFFALEAVILAAALNLLFGLPMGLGYLAVSLGIIPLVTHGITFISRLQRWTQAIWLALQILPPIYIAMHFPEAFASWTHYPAVDGAFPGFSLAGFGMAAAVVFSLIAQIGEQVDFLRFLPPPEKETRPQWWTAMLLAGPGWIAMGGFKLLVGSFLAVLALAGGVRIEQAGDPAHMYLVAFGRVFPWPTVALLAAGVFILVAQVKINVTNAYAGSIAWSNFFSRLTHSHPGRVVWLVFNVCIAFLLMELGIYEGLEQILTLFSILATSWLGIIFADLVINKPLGLSPAGIEFRRAYLYDINPVGLGSMVLATLAAALAHIGSFGALLQSFAAFIALGVAILAAPAIALLTRGRYYLARPPSEIAPEANGLVRCCICEYEFEPEDMAYCPAYEGPVCSLCCSLDARCHDGCKKHTHLSGPMHRLSRWIRFPEGIAGQAFKPILGFIATILISVSAIATILYLIYFQTSIHAGIPQTVLAAVLLKVFAAVVIVTSIVVWLLVLARESHRVAEEETQRQTVLLMEEIEAHKLTDAKLQKAKEVAEAANLAKTRYVGGISHELRAPLNAIFGYAQLLEGDAALPPQYRNAIRVVRRSSEHLSGLIEGLLDISKIEAGHLRLNIEDVRLPEFLDQIVGMFRLQAQEKGIVFTYDAPGLLPAVVHADAKRLRQILINLLSNALKFTDRGSISFTVRYRSSQLAEFDIADTGIGIVPEDMGRIFEPFERGRQPRGHAVTGMGLGLTITKLLTEILGGEISVASEVGKGSRFHVCLMLPETVNPEAARLPADHITGYLGRRRTILAADDDPDHLSLLREVLEPLDFRLICAPDGETCLAMAEHLHPDLFLLDVSMPDIDGWEVARRLRAGGFPAEPIVMVSANAMECRSGVRPGEVFDDFVVKPFEIGVLLEKIARYLGLDWTSEAAVPPPASYEEGPPPSRMHLEELRELAEMGYIRGVRAKLDSLERETPASIATIVRLRRMAEDFDLKALCATLDRLLDKEAVS
jgi:signal transduction histidine kinase/CheY-like chemotaxis protein